MSVLCPQLVSNASVNKSRASVQSAKQVANSFPQLVTEIPTHSVITFIAAKTKVIATVKCSGP